MSVGVGNEAGNARHRRFWACHHHVRHVSHHGDRDKAFRIVLDVLVERRPYGERCGAAEKKRVASGSDLAAILPASVEPAPGRFST
jgi:hypothetical protein